MMNLLLAIFAVTKDGVTVDIPELAANNTTLQNIFNVALAGAGALAVAFVGPIGFIGLVAPHIARMMFGEDHRFYLPASALVGALVLSLASVASKNLIPGVIIPVGIVTSLIGVPFFLSIILRHRGTV